MGLSSISRYPYFHFLLWFSIIFASVTCTLGLPPTEKTALLAFIQSMPNLSLLSPPWTAQKIENACSLPFQGLECSSSQGEHVVGIHIDGHALDGHIPTEVGLLTHIRLISFRSAGLVGPLPVEIFGLQSLQQIDFSENRLLSGSIPDNLSNMTHLALLDLSYTSISGTIPNTIGKLTSLSGLQLDSTRVSGSIPASIGNLTSLISLALSNTGVSGTIPSTFAFLNLRTFDASNTNLEGSIDPLLEIKTLATLNLDDAKLTGTISPKISLVKDLLAVSLRNNRLTGNLPPFPSMSSLNLAHNNFVGSLDDFATSRVAYALDLSYNNLSGTIPSEILEHTQTILLKWNNLSGLLPQTAFMGKHLDLLDASNNQLEGALPSQIGSSVEVLILSHNRFNGTFPAAYCSPDIAIENIDVSYNLLSGEFPFCNDTSFIRLEVTNNNFSGQLPTFEYFPKLTILRLSHNRFSGSIPRLPKSIVSLEANNNALTSGLEEMLHPEMNFLLLQLSHNRLQGTVPTALLYLASSVSLANNELSGSFPSGWLKQPTVAFLDLSNNHLSGPLPQGALKNLVFLRLANNQFTDGLPFTSAQLSFLDISNNRFKFALRSLTQFPLLSQVIAPNNLIYGSVTDLFDQDIILSRVELRQNQLAQPLDLDLLSSAFHRTLTYLDIRDNPIPTISTIPSSSDIRRTDISSKSKLHPHIVCYELTFSNLTVNFYFDEGLFDWYQCDCAADGYFGVPPTSCFACPDTFICNGTYLSIQPNQFMFPITHNNDTAVSLKSETCFQTAYDTSSSCQGLELARSQYSELITDPQSITRRQCAPGSRGRMCQDCICDTPSSFGTPKSCYFSRGNLCVHCKEVYDPKKSLIVAVVVAIIATLLLSGVMYLILQNKRESKDTKWEELPLMKRILNRALHAADFGFVSIAVTFVQLLSELTDWDNYVLRSYAKLLNAQTEALGLRCIFPFVSHPMSLLLFQLFLPLLVIFLVSMSILLAELYTIVMQHRATKRAYRHLDEDSLLGSSSQAEDFGYTSSEHSMIDIGLKAERRAIKVDYPARALLSSVSISLTHFFYFGLALSSLQYFFLAEQRYTHLKYVLSEPWMLFSSASKLRFVSLVWVIAIVTGVPVAFVIACYRLRHKIGSPTLAKYLGTVFSRFKTTFFWWEIVNVLRKLAIAIFLRTIGGRSSVQFICIILTLILTQILQTTFQPWKLRTENILDHLSSALLILNYFVSHIIAASQKNIAAVAVALSLDLAFLIYAIFLLAYTTYSSETPYQVVWNARFGLHSDASSESRPESAPGSYLPILSRSQVVSDTENLD